MATNPVTPLPKPVFPNGEPEVAALLQHIKDICKEMRGNEDKVKELGVERRQTVTMLRDRGVTWREIAKWAGTTDQALYKHQSRTFK